MADDPIPAIVRHMTIAIMRKNGLTAVTKARFRQAYDIAVAQCNKHGYTAGGKPTAKGLKHEREGFRGFVKNRIFDAMFAWIIKTKKAEKGTELKKQPGEQDPKSEEFNEAHHLGRNKRK